MTSLVGALGAKFPDSSVIYEDRREDWSIRGLGGWTQLHDSVNGWIGSVQIQPLPHGGDLHMVLATRGTSAEPAAVTRERDASAINRLNLVGSVFDFEVWWAWDTTLGGGYGPRAVQFGVDAAVPFTGGPNRHYGAYRWAAWSNENGTWQNTRKIQVIGSNGLPVDLPGSPTYNASFNEGKADANYFRGRYDAVNGKYAGAIFGNQGFGCFRAASGAVDPTGGGDSAFLGAVTSPASTLETFSNGCNPTIDSLGRVDSVRTQAKVHVFSTRFSKVD